MAQTTLNTLLDREAKGSQTLLQSQDLQKHVQIKQNEVAVKIKDLEHKAKMIGLTDLSFVDQMSNSSSTKPD